MVSNKNDQKVYSCKHIIASNSTLISKRAKWFDLDMNEIAALVEQSKITIPIVYQLNGFRVIGSFFEWTQQNNVNSN